MTGLRRARPVIPVATRAYRVRVAVATVQFSRAAERANRPAGGRFKRLTRTSPGGPPVSQNSTACTRSRPAGCGPGRARFGRRARPHGRWPADPPRS
jgi:hypothetical protein